MLEADDEPDELSSDDEDQENSNRPTHGDLTKNAHERVPKNLNDISLQLSIDKKHNSGVNLQVPNLAA